MTNPIKRFFQLIKAIVLFPVSFLQVRRAYQELEKLEKISDDPEKLKKALAKMGVEEEMMPFFESMIQQEIYNQPMTEVDLSYLEEEDEGEDDDDTYDD